MSHIERTGLLFRCGDYASHDFSLTAEEMAAAVAAFAPVPIELSHTPTVLDGKLGELVAVEQRGDVLYGTARLPEWLDGLLDEGKRKVSVVWDRATKRITRLGIVPSPRVTDAVLMAAFAAANPPAPAARRARTAAATAHLQQIHDAAARYDPSTCGGEASMSGACPGCKADPVRPEDRNPKTFQHKAIHGIHDLAVHHGADCPGGAASMSTTPPGGRFRPMSWIKKLNHAMFGAQADEIGVDPDVTEDEARAMFTALGNLDGAAVAPAVVVEKPATEAPPAKAPTPEEAAAAFAASPLYKDMQAKIAAMEARVEADRIARLVIDAENFAAAEIKDGRWLPTDRYNLMAAFTIASEDDRRANKEVTFSAGAEQKKGSRVDLLKALVAARPAHALFGEHVRGGLPEGSRALDNALFGNPGADPDKVDEAELERLRNLNPTLRAHHAAKANGRAS
jgi:hypothetical protein